jgi:shikimate kinase
MHRPVFLTGFMGSGKSFWGRRLAWALDIPFFDLDTVIETAEGRDIPTLFRELGESGFRQLERQHLHTTAGTALSVISTGGGAPCFADTADWMLARGQVIFLDPPLTQLLARLRTGQETRPLLAGKNPEELSHFVANLLEKRRPFYKKCHFRVSPPDWPDPAFIPYIQGLLRDSE